MRWIAPRRSTGTARTELWLVDLRRAGPALRALERACPRLSPGDRRRARRLGQGRERSDRLAAYVALRLLLERADGPRIRGREFLRSGSGKPRLRGGAAFSLAHTGSLALIGITHARAIGIDLEPARPVRVSPRRRAEIVAAARGLAGAPLDAEDGDGAFLQAWSRLEAYAKAHGEGLDRVLAQLGLRAASGREMAISEIESAARRLARGAGVIVRDVALPRGLTGAVAIAGHGAPPRLSLLPAGRRALRRLADGRC